MTPNAAGITRHLRLATRSVGVVALAWAWDLILRRTWRPRLVFMVYPASARFRRQFIYDSLYHRVPRPEIVPIGLIRRGKQLGVYATATEALREVDDEGVRRATRAITRAFPGARSVALAGSWPSMLAKAGGANDAPPLVDATLGTVYAMDRVCEAMVRRRGLEPAAARLAVVGGGGFVGRELLPRLQDRYRELTAVDPCYAVDDRSDRVLRTADGGCLADADAVLVLTPRGDDAFAYATHARSGQVWGDDTFPDMTLATRQAFLDRGVDLVRTAMTDGVLRFVPPLPTFGRDHVPGCLVAALVNEARPGRHDPERFYELADGLGLRARLFPHVDHQE